jgi:hypothetical protein
MTEAEWLTCTDPGPMLEFLRGKVSDRKLRLFACACCRRIWHLLPDERSRRAVAVAESYADNAVGKNELERARMGARSATRKATENAYPSSYQRRAARWASEAPAQTTSKEVRKVAQPIVERAAAAAAEDAGLAGAAQGLYATARSAKLQSERIAQAALLRDVIGTPFRPVTVGRAWLAWNGGTVGKLAQAIYDERAFDRLPVLADALEEAGCDNENLLRHCREPGEHVRGCWVIDLFLGRQ